MYVSAQATRDTSGPEHASNAPLVTSTPLPETAESAESAAEAVKPNPASSAQRAQEHQPNGAAHQAASPTPPDAAQISAQAAQRQPAGQEGAAASPSAPAATISPTANGTNVAVTQGSADADRPDQSAAAHQKQQPKEAAASSKAAEQRHRAKSRAAVKGAKAGPSKGPTVAGAGAPGPQLSAEDAARLCREGAPQAVRRNILEQFGSILPPEAREAIAHAYLDGGCTPADREVYCCTSALLRFSCNYFRLFYELFPWHASFGNMCNH